MVVGAMKKERAETALNKEPLVKGALLYTRSLLYVISFSSPDWDAQTSLIHIRSELQQELCQSLTFRDLQNASLVAFATCFTRLFLALLPGAGGSQSKDATALTRLALPSKRTATLPILSEFQVTSLQLAAAWSSKRAHWTPQVSPVSYLTDQNSFCMRQQELETAGEHPSERSVFLLFKTWLA